LSPVILNAAFDASGIDAVFVAFEVAPGRAGAAVDAMRALGLVGLSVTMPHKSDVISALDRCSPEAEALGAVNCIAWQGGDLVGHNTDGAGFVDAVEAATGRSLAGRAIAVLGAGGAARAVVLTVARAGAASVTVVNRTPERAVTAAALAGDVGTVGGIASVTAADLVVNATPVGMGSDGRLPVEPAALRGGQVVVDLVYNPVETPLLRAAVKRGATAIDGVGMLVHQAAHAYRHWIGQEPPLDVMTAAARAALETH